MDGLYKMLEKEYDIKPLGLVALEGYADKTYRLEGSAGKYILKEHAPSGGLIDRIDLESRMMEHFGTDTPYQVPLPVRTRAGMPCFSYEGKVYRVLEFLEGTFMGDAETTPEMLNSLGRLLGTMAQKSLAFPSYPGGMDPHPWDLKHLALSLENLPLLTDPKMRSRVAYMAQQFKAALSPVRYKLRRAWIHNDANEWNLLVREGEVSGLIDFGDACHSWLVADLAVGITYALMGRKDPLRDAAIIIGAYSEVCAPEASEMDVLYYLIGGRLCMSLCNAAAASRVKPDSEYITISAAPAWELLNRWIRIGPRAASNAFRHAAGYEPMIVRPLQTYESKRREFFSDALSLSYARPLVMERAAFQYMFDHEGNSILDAYNNIMLVGHAHPLVVSRTVEALQKLNTNTRYHYDALPDYAEALLRRFPPELSRIFFVNSGSAATDLALRLARHYTGNTQVLAIENGYHGNTAAGIAVSHYKHQAGFSYPGTLLTPMPKTFGTEWPDDGTAGAKFGAACVAGLWQSGPSLAAFIAEPIMGCGGQVPLPSGYLEAVYPEVRKRGGLCISDEVQVGFGRLGSHFWGFERHGVVPDMVILGKPMGNGHPIGAVVCTERVADAFASGPEFFSSFGGNPVSCAAGKAVLDVIEQEGLDQHAKDVGAYLLEGLQEIQAWDPGVVDVRGAGLFIGVELCNVLGLPDTQRARYIKNTLREKHVLIGTDGPDDNVLKIKPPLPFDLDNCDELLRKLGGIARVRPVSAR